MVRKGDSLWGLAGIYLGSGTRYPSIVDHHNKEASRLGRHSGLLPIADPNLIYVGQTVMAPSRPKNPVQGTGKRLKANKPAAGLYLKLEYNFEKGMASRSSMRSMKILLRWSLQTIALDSTS